MNPGYDSTNVSQLRMRPTSGTMNITARPTSGTMNITAIPKSGTMKITAKPMSGTMNITARPKSGTMNITARPTSGIMNSKGHNVRPASGTMNITGHNVRPLSGNKILTYTEKFNASPPKKVELFLPQEMSAPSKKYRPKRPLSGNPQPRPPRHSKKPQPQADENDNPTCFTHVFDGRQLMIQNIEESEKTKSRRRVQSAKPRMVTEDSVSQDDDLYIFKEAQTSKKTRPISAVELGSGSPWNYSYIWDIKASRSDKNLTESSSAGDKRLDGLEPCVFGYKTQSYVSGHSPDVTTNDLSGQNLRVKSGHARVKFDEVGIAGMTGGLRTRTMPDDDNVSLSELLDFEDLDEELDQEDDNPVPRTLRPLLPWATPEVTKDIIGIDPSKCLIFLPSLRSQIEELPAPTKPGDELPHKVQISVPEEPVKSKKYDHPWNKIPIEEHVCNHRQKRHEAPAEVVETPRQIKVYTTDGRLLHQTFFGMRTEEVVRKEIQELEDLMLGIGTLNGCSMVVQYQAEINRLHNMVNRTLGRVEEIEQREAEKRRLAKPPDYFGLREYYENHDELMLKLHDQHTLCMRELATITSDLEMNTAREHFERRLKLSEDEI